MTARTPTWFTILICLSFVLNGFFTSALPVSASSHPSQPSPDVAGLSKSAGGLAVAKSVFSPSQVSGRVVSCDLYPLAIHVDGVKDALSGDVIEGVTMGRRPGQFGWLTWTGDTRAQPLLKSLTPPGNASSYVNPQNPDDHLVSIGNWVSGKPLVADSRVMNAALDNLKKIDISVPLWDEVEGYGEDLQYRVASYAKVRLIDYGLPGMNDEITVQFLGYNLQCGDNFAPVANADAYTTNEDEVLSVPAPGVLANDTDANTDPLWSVLVSPTLHGDLALQPDGSFVYTPTLNFNGEHAFTYQATDGELLSATTTVSITVAPVNDPPVAMDDAYDAKAGEPLVVPAAGVLQNDTDVDSPTLTALLDAGPAHGELALNLDGSFTYTATVSFSGEDSFTYKANDGFLDSNIATVHLNVAPSGVCKTYTTNADFDEGQYINVGHAVTDQLQLDDTTSAFAFIWVAVSTKGTIVKINTETGQVLGEYLTAPQGQPTDPSRTTVDHNGSVWATNRAGNSVVHIGLLENNQCVDRNGNGQIDTSAGLNDLRAWPNTGGADTNGGVSTAADECILHYTRVSSSGTRHVSVTANNDVWVSGTGNRVFDLLDGTTGEIVRTEGPVGYGGYGGLIDSHGVIWSARPMLRWDTSKPLSGPNGGNWQGYGHDSYGLCIDSQGNVWNASHPNNVIYKFAPDGTLIGSYGHGDYYAQGCTVDKNDHVWVANSLYRDTVGHLLNNGTFIGNVTVGSGPTGVAVDAAGKIWATNYNSGTVSRIDPNAGPIGADGVTHVGAVDFTTEYLGGNLYNYSDMTGSTLSGAPDNGAWTVVYDSGIAGAEWGTLSWADFVAGDGALSVTAASSEDGVAFSPAETASKGSDISVPNGRYLRMSVSFGRASSGESPVLYDLTSCTSGIAPPNQPPIAVDDTYETNEDVALDVGASSGVLANDDDPNGENLAARLVAGPQHGTLVMSEDGSFTYTPAANFNGSDGFSYVATDGALESNTATVSISVISVNRAPVAVDDSYSTASGQQLVVPAPGVLTNDSDPDGDPLTAILVTSSAQDALIQHTDEAAVHAAVEATSPLPSLGSVAGAQVASVPISNTQGTPDTPVAPTFDHAPTPSFPTAKVTSQVSGGDLADLPHGSLTLNPDGSFTYTPAAGFTGTDTFTYKASDGQTVSNIATVTVYVGEAVLIPYHGGTYKYLVVPLGNMAGFEQPKFDDSAFSTGDGDFGNLSQCAINTPAYVHTIWPSNTDILLRKHFLLSAGMTNLRVGIGIDNDVQVFINGYDISEGLRSHENCPDVNDFVFNVPNSVLHEGDNLLAVRGRDRGYASFLGVQLIADVQHAPLAVDDSYKTTSGTNLSISAPGVLANDYDASGHALTAVMVSVPAHGNLMLSPDGSFIYTPNPDFVGTDEFPYKANDGEIDSNTARVKITVGPSHDTAPVAVDDAYEVAAGQTLIVTAPGVLDNDTDPDGGILSAIRVTDPAHGFLTLNSDGSFTYTPAAGFTGADPFTYKANDGAVDSNVATVTITVTAPPNRAPVATDDSYSTLYQTAVSVPAPGILANDTDPDGDQLIALLVDGTSHGSLAGNVNGSFTYTPNTGYSGPDSFTYKASDGELDSNVATVTITVGGSGNHAPVASNDSYELDEDKPLTVSAGGVLSNDSDTDGDKLTAVLASNPAHGVLVLDADGAFTYTPDQDYNGSDSFTYRASDGALYSNVVSVSLTIHPINDAPVATDYHEPGVPEDTPWVCPAPCVLNRAYDVDNDPLTAKVGAPPAHGVLDLKPDGGFEYTPALNYFGPDSFTYIANDGKLDSNPGTISITVNPINDAPVATNDAYEVNAGETLTITAPGILANDIDVENDPLKAVGISYAGSGNLKVNADGSFIYTPPANFHGSDGLYYKANDGQADSSLASVTITVNASGNRPPVVTDDDYITAPGATLNVSEPGVLANDSDPDKDPLNARLVAPAAHGDVALNPNGSFTYMPASGYSGPDAFTYVANDGKLDSAVATAHIAVTTEAPNAEITMPTEGTRVTTSTDIVGTASSDALAYYTLSYRLRDDAGTANWTEFHKGTTAVTNGVLGSLDPSLLLNGTYEIRLMAVDVGNQAATVTTSVVVEGQRKVGIFTLSFTDLEVPVAGIPIQVIRTYDSRNKSQGDFGVGWTLDVKTARVQENKALGQDWQGTVSGGFLPNYCIVPVRPNVVTISLPDGSVFRFEPVLSPNNGCQQIEPLSEVSISYRALPGTIGSLAPIGNNTFQVEGSFPGYIDLMDLSGAVFADFDQYELTLYDGRKLTIDQQAGLKSMKDLNNNTLTVTSTGITHSSGKSVTFTRDAQNRITEVTDPAGHDILYTYNAQGDLADVTDRMSNVTRFTYDANHYLLDINDPRGVRAIRTEYDEAGRIVRQIDADGKEITYDHQLDANQELVTNRLGDQTSWEYDDRGNVTRQTDALGKVTTYTYDANDNQLTETDPLGHTTTNTYDSNYNLLTTTDPLGHRTTYTYNSRGQVLTVTDPRGKITTNTYDANGNLLSTEDSLHNVTSYTYDAAGNRTSMKDANEQVTTYEYDAAGNLTREVDALGRATGYTYDANGNRLTETRTMTLDSGPEMLTTTYEYDAAGRLTVTTYPDGSTTRTEYNNIGQQSATVDQLGRRTTYEYNLSGHLYVTTYPDSATESITYDAEGRTVTTTDRMNRITGYEYDAVGRQTKTTYPGGATTQTTYDDAGRTDTTIDERGNVTRYAYDAAGRREQVINALDQVTRFGYDEAGNQTSVTDANNHTMTYLYDDAGRRTQTLYPDGTSTTTGYDKLGRRIAETDQASKTTEYGYDELGRPTSVKDALGQVTSYTYDEAGNQLTQTDANGHTTTFSYDKMGRRTSRKLPLGMTETSTYRCNGLSRG